MWRRSRVIRRRIVLLCTAASLLPLAVFWLPWLLAQYDLYRGRAALQRFQAEAALKWLQAGQKLDADSAEMNFLLGRALRRLGRFDEMGRHLERARQLGFPLRRIERERRLALAQTARVEEVQADLPEMLTSAGDDGAEICAAYVNGFCLVLDFESANRLLDAWSADIPADPEPHFQRGNLWYAQNEWKNAVPAYLRCLELDPSRTKARLSLAQCLLKMNEPAQAEQHFRRCLNDDPGNLDIWLGLATCLMTLGNADDAQKALQYVAGRSPRHFEARRRLGELELEADRPEAALKWLAPLAEDWPDDSTVAKLMAQALQETGNVTEARKHWEKVRLGEEAISRLEKLSREVRGHPDDPELRYELGIMLMRYRSRDDGASWLRSLLQYDPHHRRAHRALADYYSKIGEVDRANEHRRLADAPEHSHGS
jgi:tetratricopeptide (TPR) repeat protein